MLQVIGDEKTAKPADADSSGGLWNAQPFRQNPGVDIPDCPAGCARAQGLQVWGIRVFMVCCAYSARGRCVLALSQPSLL